MDVQSIIQRHEARRRGGINLIASENVMSPGVADALSCDMAGRYHAEFYGGSEEIRELISRTEALARRIFRAEYALVTPLSGNVCDLATLFAFSRAGDAVASMPFEAGGYPFGFGLFQRRHIPLTNRPGTFEVDTAGSLSVIRGGKPAYVMLGASYIPFPHPVKEVRSGYGGPLVYDGSHVLGLIATGEFQDPLGEGADVLIGSTHKTLYGPQGGLILTNDEGLYRKLKVYADIDFAHGLGLVDNPHSGRLAALALALEELRGDGDYGKRVVENARTLARALHENGVPVRFRDRGFTASHQVFFDMPPEKAGAACRLLAKYGVFVDTAGRVGAAEATHIGMGASEMEEVAHLIAEVLCGSAGDDTRRRIGNLAREFYGRFQGSRS